MMIAEGARVAVVDDVRHFAETTADIATEAGLIASIISEDDGPFHSPEELLDRVTNSDCAAVICDHRLSQTPFASFTGAQFVSDLYANRIPGVLLSTFLESDTNTSIRLHRARIPSLIDRGGLDPDQILEGLNLCQAELNGDVTPERQPRRTLVRIVGISEDENGPVAEVIVHTWKPDEPIRFPVKLIEDSQIREILTTPFNRVLRLFARVNVGCQNESDLFFEGFEFAPEPNVEDLEA